MMDVQLVHGDDWTALYIDGELVEQNHEIAADVVIEALKVRGVLSPDSGERYATEQYLDQMLETGDGFPTWLTDIEFEQE